MRAGVTPRCGELYASAAWRLRELTRRARSGFQAAIVDLRGRGSAEGRTAKDDGRAVRRARRGQALATRRRQFLERADARFRQSEETAGQNLKALLQPVSDRLQRYEEGVAKVEAERRDAFGDSKGQIEQMRIGQEKVSSEAAKLVNSLRNAPKSRGRWGEQQLRNVLETCGLAEHTDFQTEVSVAGGDEGGRLRPDAIIRVPGGRALVIDAKVSLNAYQDAFGAVDEAERARGLRRARRLDARARQRPGQQGLLEPVRRRARLCHHVRARRAFPVRRAGA